MCDKNNNNDKNINSSYFDLIDFENVVTYKNDKDEDKTKSKLENREILKEAFEFANACREEEIKRFWSRGLYFWGFITSAYVAYFSVLSLMLNGETLGFQNLIDLSFFQKTVLTAISFLCFIFTLSWQLIHKGSKYWQENWEAHVCMLGKSYIGKIYETNLCPIGEKFGKCFFSPKAYDYSVSKISSVTSIILALFSLGLFTFNIATIFLPKDYDYTELLNKSVPLNIILGIFVLLIFVGMFGLICKTLYKKHDFVRKDSIPFEQGRFSEKNCEKFDV